VSRESEPGRPVRFSAGGIARLRELLREGGGLMSDLVSDGGAPEGLEQSTPNEGKDGKESGIAPSGASPAVTAAAGPRAEGRREEYELLVEAIYEGYLLHYGRPRLIAPPEADLGLLAGDRLYAIGLARLVELGDTLAVSELADTITLSALAHGSGRPELAEATWAAGAAAVGWGSSSAHRRAKEMVLEGDPLALEAMRTCARRVPAPR
jgi:hypothetical protein